VRLRDVTTRTFVKICGICNLEDAQVCAAAGVDAVGFLLEKQPGRKEPESDRLSVTEAKALVAALPSGLIPVLLVHKSDVDAIVELCEEIRPRALQIQVSVEPRLLLELRERRPEVVLIKTFHMAADATVDSAMREIQEYVCCDSIDAVVLDSSKGGSGQVHDWELSSKVAALLGDVPLILAGGLTHLNVTEALHRVRPWGVDVMSGVNSIRHNKKDPEKIRAFVQAVREGRKAADADE
jgi:phosphoribosylanthranilate isomerase